MRTAQRRKKKISLTRKRFPFLRLFLGLLALLFVFFFFSRETKFWNGEDRLSLVINKGDGSVEVTTFDPKASEITTIFIPGETQVEVAKNLGVWRLSAVWQLSKSQKIGGSLLARTTAKNFSFPVFVWADFPASGFVGGGASDLLKSVFVPYSTNLGLGDKIRLGLFVLGVKNIDRNTINLADTGVLKKTTLKDGSKGYTVFTSIPPDIAAVFSDRSANQNLKVEIVDGTRPSDAAENVGRVIEVLGPKVALVQKGDVAADSCLVSGKHKELNDKVARIFGCKLEGNKNNNFDLTIKLPENFPDNF